MIKKFFLFFLSAVFVFSFFSRAQAHTFLTDGDITVLFHANPNDDPIVGQPAGLLFQVTDSTNKFQASQCDCNLTISENNKILLSAPLLRVQGESVYDFIQPFTFPETAVYQIIVTGQPKVAGQFQSFQVQYNQRVDQVTTQPSIPTKNKLNTWLILAGLGLFAMIVGVVIYFKGNKRK